MTNKELISFLVSVMVLTAIVCLLTGFFIGYYLKQIKDLMVKLFSELPEPPPPIEVGVVQGSLHEPDKTPPVLMDKSKKTGAVIAKSPQQIEYEEQERIRRISKVSV
jgi:uncharacterized protein YneF (UPF0154 family)